MQYAELLEQLHRELSPANYLEIGCRYGRSLSLSKSLSLVIDPAPDIDEAISCPVLLFAETSDEFFRRHDPKRLLGGAVDFAFIDGMHLAEFALRDFANIEAHSHPGTVVVIDDVLPSRIEYATRHRDTKIWCGDVYRVVPLLRRIRPDLHITVLDIEVKGACLIWGLNPLAFSGGKIMDAELILEKGAFVEVDAGQIRQTLCPAPPDALPSLIKELQHFRRAASGK